MLIKCSECGRDVSDKTVACPSCGNRIAASNPAKGLFHANPVVPIEATGKRYKAGMLLAGGIFVLGLALMVSEEARVFGGLVAIVGCIGYLVARVGAWWQHG